MARERRSRLDGDVRVTVEHVARLAGVSAATVSRVVNDNPRVSPETRLAVTRAIQQLGYVPNRAARSLMTRRSDSIGVVILEPAAHLFGDPFFGQLILGISSGLAERDLQLVLLLAPTRPEVSRVEGYLAAGHVDGAILVGPRWDDPLAERLTRAGLRVVLSGRPEPGSNVSFVDADNRTGARNAVAHLLEIGRRRIATIYGNLALVSGRDRLDGYRDALSAAGVGIDPSLEAPGGFSANQAVEAMQLLLERRPDLDGVFAASDTMASYAMRVLQAAGRRIPEDVAVVGFDDTPLALASQPPLSTVRQPIEAMGLEMTRLLLQRLDNPDEPPGQTIFATELIVRQSSASGVPAGDRSRT